MNETLCLQSAEIFGQQTFGDTQFPFVIDPSTVHATLDDTKSLSQVCQWVGKYRGELLDLAAQHGAVALRGFPTTTVEAFDEAVGALKIANFPYRESLSNAVRVNRTERVFSANEAPPEVRIYFHHEMAQTPLYPRWIAFYCEIPPTRGGQTPLCRSDVLFERLAERAPQFADRCERLGLRYTNVMPDSDDANSGMGRSWRKTLGVDDSAAAEQRLAQLGYVHEWLADGCLKVTTPQLPAVLEVGAGRKAFFNQLIAAYCGWSDSRNDPSDAIRHGDGSKLDADGVAIAVELSEQLTYDHDWQQGDIVLLDNTVAMHARRPFEGTRKILASLAEKQSHVLTKTV